MRYRRHEELGRTPRAEHPVPHAGKARLRDAVPEVPRLAPRWLRAPDVTAVTRRRSPSQSPQRQRRSAHAGPYPGYPALAPRRHALISVPAVSKYRLLMPGCAGRLVRAKTVAPGRARWNFTKSVVAHDVPAMLSRQSREPSPQKTTTPGRCCLMKRWRHRAASGVLDGLNVRRPHHSASRCTRAIPRLRAMRIASS